MLSIVTNLYNVFLWNMYFICVDCDFQSTITIDFLFYVGSMWNITFAKLYSIPYLTFDVIAIIRQINVIIFFLLVNLQKVNRKLIFLSYNLIYCLLFKPNSLYKQFNVQLFVFMIKRTFKNKTILFFKI